MVKELAILSIMNRKSVSIRIPSKYNFFFVEKKQGIPCSVIKIYYIYDVYYIYILHKLNRISRFNFLFFFLSVSGKSITFTTRRHNYLLINIINILFITRYRRSACSEYLYAIRIKDKIPKAV